MAAAIALVLVPAAGAVPDSELTRYPYLTDLVGSSVTVNWATVRDESAGTARWGAVSDSCTANSVAATRTPITVNGIVQYQWRATITGLTPGVEYCYRVLLDDTDLLASDPAPNFQAQVPTGSDEPFSFVVFGDWGKVDADGTNTHQANVINQIAASDARFAVTTGDVPYSTNQPLGSSTDTHYGDLTYPMSTVFGTAGWPVAGKSIPIFVAAGNHGRNSSFLRTWPQPTAVAESSGRYEMETYCCLNGTNSASYPSAWYAFSAGNARFYVLDTSWSNQNIGTADSYKNDYDYHWTPESAEYQWLENDLESHSEAVKLAFFHHPPRADNATET